MTNENEAIGKLVRDYQAILTRLACVASELHTRAKAIERVTSTVKDRPEGVAAIEGGFRVPSDAFAVIGDDGLSFDALSIEALHQDLTAWAEAVAEKARLERLLNDTGLSRIIRE